MCIRDRLKRLVVASVEMQAVDVLDATPVAAEGGLALRVDRDQRRGDALAAAPGGEEQPVARHRRRRAGEEVARQVGRRVVRAVGEGVAAVEEVPVLSLIHISEPTRLLSISYAVFCL